MDHSIATHSLYMAVAQAEAASAAAYAMAEELVTEKRITVSQACEILGISRQTWYRRPRTVRPHKSN